MPVRIVAALLVVLGLAEAGLAQDRVLNTLSPDQIEQLLKGSNLNFKKSGSPNDGKFFYDFNLSRTRFNARLYYNQGKDIMLDIVFTEQPLEKLNTWNSTKAKFTRATSRRDAKTAYATLEANLNFAGGVTDSIVRRFLYDFEEEAAAFDRFLSDKLEPSGLVLGPDGDRIIALTQDKVDDILRKMRLNAKLQPFNGGAYYDYESSRNHKIRLTNVKNQELTLDAVFKKVPLETINKYNFQRKFIRAVLYTQGNVEYTALEANLDCSVGVSENMVRHFMITFEEEVQSFIEFLKKN